jgi:hypothetical protein
MRQKIYAAWKRREYIPCCVTRIQILLNPEGGRMYRKNKRKYNRKVRENVEQSWIAG